MCGGFWCELRENKRSDPVIFDFIRELRVDEPEEMSLDAAKQRAFELFPLKATPAHHTLTMSHARRMAINQKRNAEFKPAEGAIFVKPTKAYQGENQPQDMYIWPGLIMIGFGHKVHKGVFVTIKSCDQNSITLSNGTVLTHEQAGSSLRLTFGLTYACSQGLSLPGRVRLETQSPYFTMKHLYVGCSRATSHTLLDVC